MLKRKPFRSNNQDVRRVSRVYMTKYIVFLSPLVDNFKQIYIAPICKHPKRFLNIILLQYLTIDFLKVARLLLSSSRSLEL